MCSCKNVNEFCPVVGRIFEKERRMVICVNTEHSRWRIFKIFNSHYEYVLVIMNKEGNKKGKLQYSIRVFMLMWNFLMPIISFTLTKWIKVNFQFFNEKKSETKQNKTLNLTFTLSLEKKLIIIFIIYKFKKNVIYVIRI